MCKTIGGGPKVLSTWLTFLSDLPARRLQRYETVCHGAKEYARGDVNTNTVESSFALVKCGIVGIYHNGARSTFTVTFGNAIFSGITGN